MTPNLELVVVARSLAWFGAIALTAGCGGKVDFVYRDGGGGGASASSASSTYVSATSVSASSTWGAAGTGRALVTQALQVQHLCHRGRQAQGSESIGTGNTRSPSAPTKA